jgi:NitT/TauT family transport system ATP-binding protein
MEKGAMSAMTELQFQHVHKAFGTTLAVSDVSFRIASRSFGVVIGPSGCGKSTLLSLAAGLDEPSSGYVFLGGREVRGIRDDVALLFQNYNLFPWMTAQANVAFGLTMRRMSRRAASTQALDYLNDVGLGACAPRIPDELSGGMKQRVALARALALKPSILLMDEPFAALDYQTRKIMQRYLLATRVRTGATILLVTHDLVEALTLADRLIMLSGTPGTVQEVIDIKAPHPRDLSHPVLAGLMRKLEAHLEAEAASSEFTTEERNRIMADG